MAKNDLILLDSIIEDRVNKRIPSDKKDEVFEYLTYEQVLKEFDLSKDDILSGSVDGRNDGGIDAIFIFVNGNLITSTKNSFMPKSNAILEVFFFTCKHLASFKQNPINNIYTSLSELLDFSKKSDELDGDYNDDVLCKRDMFLTVYKKMATIIDSFTFKVIFASRGDSENGIGDNVESRGKQIETLCKANFSGCEAKFEFWGAEKLMAAYRKKIDHSLSLDVQECLTHGKQMVVLANIKDYYNFITYEDSKKIRKYLFDSNVRDFMGINSVNEDILETLQNNRYEEDFWWLNNGITILCSSAHTVGKSITIENVQIVNGLQTSECIYRYFADNDINDHRVVLIKILPCDNSLIADDITRSTNNQTAVMSGSLRATDKIQEDIEEILKQEDIYYERRINYYLNQGYPAEKIVSPLYMAKGYTALVLKKPYRAISLKQKFMRSQKTYERVFNEADDIRIWPQIAKIMKKTDEYMSDLRDKDCGERFLLNVRYQVALLTIARIYGTFTFTQKNLIDFDIKRYSYSEVQKTWEDINTVTGADDTCRRWKSRSVSLNITETVAKMESIANFDTISPQTRYGIEDFPDDLLDDILKALPDQPWPKGVHKSVAREMGIDAQTVSKALAILIRKKLVKMQKNGVIL